MAVFEWRRRPTRHFGDEWIPCVDLSLKSATGRWRDIAVHIDTGAVVSVLRSSVAEMLGISVTNGEQVDLSGIGAPARHYYLHVCTARIGNLPEFKMRIAFSDGMDVPNLLGRLDVLDRFHLTLDPSRQESRFAIPTTT
ncbi:MAG: aspartyl protease family protein [Planctomycetes bacterium]|nr:aspartyl protease family protein [Planctomycetota bacterium]